METANLCSMSLKGTTRNYNLVLEMQFLCEKTLQHNQSNVCVRRGVNQESNTVTPKLQLLVGCCQLVDYDQNTATDAGYSLWRCSK